MSRTVVLASVVGLLGSTVASAQTPKRAATLRVSYGNEIAPLDSTPRPATK